MGGAGPLHAAFGIHECRVLFGIGRTGKNHIGPMSPGIPMMALIDDERFAQSRHIHLIGPQQPDQPDIAGTGARKDSRNVAPTVAWQQVEVEPADAACGPLQKVEPVPIVFNAIETLGNCACRCQHRRPIGPRDGARAQDHHGLIRCLQDLAKIMLARGNGPECLRSRAQMLRAVGEVHILPNDTDGEAAFGPARAQPGIDDGGFRPWIGADDETGIGLIDPGDGGIEKIRGPGAAIDLGAVLAAIDIGGPQRRHQVLQCRHGLAIGEIPGNGRNGGALHSLQPTSDGGEGFIPAGFREFAVTANIGPIQPLTLEPVIGEAGFVGNPFLVHVFIEPRQDPHYLRAACIDADVRAHRVQHVHRFGLAQFPGTRRKGIGLRGQRADGTKVDHVARQFRGYGVAHIGADLHVLAAPCEAKLFHAGDFGGEPHAPGAVNTAGHLGFDQGAEILVGNGALVFFEPRPVEPVEQGLVLKVAFASLIANRAIQRMIDEKHLHHPATGFAGHFRIGLDHHAVADRHGAGCGRLWRPRFDLHQAHAAVAGDG